MRLEFHMQFPSPCPFCLLLALLLGCCNLVQAEKATLTRVEQIRALSREQAAKAQPVRLRGVVTWQDADPMPAFFVHDGASSIWIARSMESLQRPIAKLVPSSNLKG
jgi:hypothetical protein